MDTISTSVSSLKVPTIRRNSADFYNFKNPYTPPSSSSHFNFRKPTSLISNKTNSFTHKKTCNFPTTNFPSLSKNPLHKQPSLRHHQTAHTRASSGYATALIDIAKCNNSLENLEKDVRRLSKWLRNEQLSAIMTDPFVENKEKGYVLKEILSKGKFNKYLVSVVKLLVEKKKVGIVDEVLMEFERIYDQLCGTQVVLVSSKVKMEKCEIFEIANKLQEFSGAEKVKVKEVDPTIENEEGGSEGVDGFFSDLANAVPGIDEAMSFAEMLKLVKTMDYSVIVFDTAPTGHTLRLLQFPSTLEEGLAKIMSLKSKFGGVLSQMTRIFGVDDEFGEDAILGKLEAMRDIIEQVNRQFKDPDMTTFVCVCIPEFLSLYETERLVQELTRFEIDTHNIIINQVLFDVEVVESQLLKARMRMQQKYLDQFYTLYDDFNITKLPLLPQEVCGVEALKTFKYHFLTPYRPSRARCSAEELESGIAKLKEQLKDAEAEYEKIRKGKNQVQC